MSESTDLIIRSAEILYPDGHLEQWDVAIAKGKIQMDDKLQQASEKSLVTEPRW